MKSDAELRWFRNPDTSWVVVRRRATIELLCLFQDLGSFVLTRGWSALGVPASREAAAYRAAQTRLRRSGLIAYRRAAGQPAVLELAPEAAERLPACYAPEKRWSERWDGRWRLLVYDIPEAQRKNRDALRRFLRQHALGELQRSVYVTPRDIRPEYDDLCTAAGVGQQVYLFEVHTVLGLKPDRIAWEAWDFDAIGRRQEWYCRSASGLTRRLGDMKRDDVFALAGEESLVYQSVMAEDPLLPRAAWPNGYQGENAFRQHKAFVNAARRLW